MNRIWIILFSVTIMSSCQRDSDVCDSDTDCFSDEQCISAECIVTLKTDTCDRLECATLGVSETICFGTTCHVATCEDGFSNCDSGCCENLPPKSAPIPTGERFVDSPDLVVDHNDDPFVVWSDAGTTNVYLSLWDGENWMTSSVVTTPAMTPIFDFDYEESSQSFFIAYLTADGEVWVGRSQDAKTWKTQRAITGPRIDLENPLSYIVINIEVRDEEPVICAVFGSFDLLAEPDVEAKLPSAQLATLDFDGKWEQVTLSPETAVLTCDAVVDELSQLHVNYTTVDTDGQLSARYGVSRFLSDPVVEKAGFEFGYFSERDSLVVRGATVRSVYNVLEETNTGTFVWLFFETTSDGLTATSKEIFRLPTVLGSAILDMKLDRRGDLFTFSFSHVENQTADAIPYLGSSDGTEWEIEKSEAAIGNEYYITAAGGNGVHTVWSLLLEGGFEYIAP